MFVFTGCFHKYTIGISKGIYPKHFKDVMNSLAFFKLLCLQGLGEEDKWKDGSADDVLSGGTRLTNPYPNLPEH